MREFEAFAHQAEDDGVLAGVVARPEGMDADLPPGRSPVRPCRPWIIWSELIARRRSRPVAAPCRWGRPS